MFCFFSTNRILNATSDFVVAPWTDISAWSRSKSSAKYALRLPCIFRLGAVHAVTYVCVLWGLGNIINEWLAQSAGHTNEEEPVCDCECEFVFMHLGKRRRRYTRICLDALTCTDF